jgi:hypothetical protein
MAQFGHFIQGISMHHRTHINMKFCLASGEWDIPEFNDEGGAGLVSTWTTRPLYI